ncbi:MAG: tol-pal system-associated acyl-CoA thioesterase [Chromatiales bacterium]|nr:tol-pal system-associated acyl-CoA thioesterase [Chromatiales bacterium]
MREFLWPVRVYYEDTDSGGVVYYANYLKFMERARTEWLRALGFEQDQLIAEQGILFAVRRVELDYRKPARFNDELVVVSTITERGKASLTFQQKVTRAEDGEVLCGGTVKIASLDAEAFRPKAIPNAILTEISHAV